VGTPPEFLGARGQSTPAPNASPPLADLERNESQEDTSDKVLLSNLGPGHVFVIISGDNSVEAGPDNGVCVLAGRRLALAYVDDGFASFFAVNDRAVVNIAIGI